MMNQNDMIKAFLINQYKFSDFKSLSPRQQLEYILSLGCSDEDVRGTAERLLKKFGDPKAVFEADPAELRRVKGVGEDEAVMLNFISQYAKIMYNNADAGDQDDLDSIEDHFEKTFDVGKLDNVDSIKDLFVKAFSGIEKETVMICCLDNELNMISCDRVYDGKLEMTADRVRKITQYILLRDAHIVIIAHNRLKGRKVPLKEELRVHKQIDSLMSDLDVTIMDHIIIVNGTAISMKSDGYLNVLD